MEKVILPWVASTTLHEVKTITVGRKRARDNNPTPQIKKGNKKN
jgi:hypothetical protein